MLLCLKWCSMPAEKGIDSVSTTYLIFRVHVCVLFYKADLATYIHFCRPKLSTWTSRSKILESSLSEAQAQYQWLLSSRVLWPEEDTHYLFQYLWSLNMRCCSQNQQLKKYYALQCFSSLSVQGGLRHRVSLHKQGVKSKLEQLCWVAAANCCANTKEPQICHTSPLYSKVGSTKHSPTLSLSNTGCISLMKTEFVLQQISSIQCPLLSFKRQFRELLERILVSNTLL